MSVEEESNQDFKSSLEPQLAAFILAGGRVGRSVPNDPTLKTAAGEETQSTSVHGKKIYPEQIRKY